MGQVTVENQLSLDIFGTHVNRASRIQSIADGGQIITSQSIWENTIGWLKNQENLGIGCLPLGKTKLKGISDPVELYSFYPKEISGKNKPRLFQTKNRKRIFFSSLLILSALILCTWSYFSIICKEAEDANSKPPLKKNYFVQFDFRNIKNQAGLDSNKIREKVLSQIVSIFYPDSVIFESDLIQQFAKKGTFYVRKNNELGDLSSTYYRDSLDMDGTLLLEFYPVDYNIQNTSLFENEKYKLNTLDIDSIEINARLDFFFPDDSTFSSKSRASIFKESISNIRNDFRNDLSYMLSLMKSDLVQGTVTNLSDSIFYFHRSNESYLKVGTQVTLTRKYSGREGLTDWLNYLMQKSEFFKGKKEYQEDFKTATKEYNHVKNNLSASILSGNSTYGERIGIQAVIIELYDTVSFPKLRPFEISVKSKITLILNRQNEKITIQRNTDCFDYQSA